jgi:hypothetical protein
MSRCEPSARLDKICVSHRHKCLYLPTGDSEKCGVFRNPRLRASEIFPKRRLLNAYCLSAAGGFASGFGAGAAGSAVVPGSSDGAAQSPAQSLVPFTVPTSLQPIGADGFACFTGLPPLGAAV